jgi:excisionase family DNA binding protein
MNVIELVKNGANVQVVVSAADLKEIFSAWQLERETEREAAAAKEHEAVIMTASEAAAMLNVSKPTLWRWGQTGYLKPIKIGKKTYYRQADLERLMEV